MDYRGASTAGKLREIGRALGVRHLLLGSVRRSENHVAVNVAMIDLSNQEQQWAQHYERTFSDALRLQNELALDIARELRATLTPAEVSLTAAKPTENASAYLCYLRGRERERIVQATPELTREAIHFYEQAVHLDPGFALARARLSLCASMLLNWEADGDFRTKARTEADEALRLDPNLGEAHLASAHCYLWGDQDYDRALDALGRAADHLPNSAEIPLTAAFIYKRQNRFRDRIAALQRAEALDPMNRTVLIYLTNTLRWVRQWHEAIKSCDRQHALAGDEEMSGWRWRRAQDEFQQTGDVGALKKAIADEMASDPQAQPAWLELARYTTAMFERDYPEAARALSQVSPQSFRQIPRALAAHTKAFDEAILAVAAGADTKQDALKIADRELQTLLAPDASPGFATNRPEVDLAVIEAFLGRKEDAIRRALEAVAQVPNPPGTIERNLVSAGLALVYAQTDEPDKAISLIEHLLTVPCELQTGTIYNMTLTDLKWRWQWDPLRSHPRFQKLLAGSEPVTVY
jgi:tetratricopeptide (TPR) repeat protein